MKRTKKSPPGYFAKFGAINTRLAKKSTEVVAHKKETDLGVFVVRESFAFPGLALPAAGEQPLEVAPHGIIQFAKSLGYQMIHGSLRIFSVRIYLSGRSAG